MNNWRGILKIEQIEHVRNSKIIWSQKNLYNLLHSSGEELLIKCCFNNDGTLPPTEYFFGLDNRSSLSKEDTMENLIDEPNTGGYARQAKSSYEGFNVEVNQNGYRAISNIMSFTAIGSGWGPVKNMFMTTSSSGESGVLISSVALSQEVTLIDGDSINLRMSLSLS